MNLADQLEGGKILKTVGTGFEVTTNGASGTLITITPGASQYLAVRIVAAQSLTTSATVTLAFGGNNFFSAHPRRLGVASDEAALEDQVYGDCWNKQAFLGSKGEGFTLHSNVGLNAGIFLAYELLEEA